jgi:hypothetical protein
MGWVAEQPDSPATRQPRLQLDRRLLRSAPNLGAPAAAFAAHQQQPPLFTANSGPPTHQLQQQARPARSEGGGGGGGHAPHVMHLPGGQVYMDARTYQELVWADLADDVEAEQAIEQRMSAGGASAGQCGKQHHMTGQSWVRWKGQGGCDLDRAVADATC